MGPPPSHPYGGNIILAIAHVLGNRHFRLPRLPQSNEINGFHEIAEFVSTESKKRYRSHDTASTSC